MPVYSASGAVRVTLDDATFFGVYMPDGSLRVDTQSPGPGVYGPSGAIRGTFDDETLGVYDPSGAIRMSETQDNDGSWFVSIIDSENEVPSGALLSEEDDPLLDEAGNYLIEEAA